MELKQKEKGGIGFALLLLGYLILEAIPSYLLLPLFITIFTGGAIAMVGVLSYFLLFPNEELESQVRSIEVNREIENKLWVTKHS